jgi:hypothetical protein
MGAGLVMGLELRLDGDTIVCGGTDGWGVPIADVRVIGEFLNKQGRGRDEYYLVFMTKEEWFKAPYYSEGREAAMTHLGQRLNHELRSDLFNSTNLSSRVLWPAPLEGRPLFDVIPEERAENLVTRVRQLLLQKVDMRFTDEVRKELGHA